MKHAELLAGLPRNKMYRLPGTTVQRFHDDHESYVRVLMGPFGSGKTTCAAYEILRIGALQRPWNGIRRTRWAVIRNTYPQLKSTTIPSWIQWVPPHFYPVIYDSPIRCNPKWTLPDGTIVDIEVWFVSVDKPNDVAKILGMELTGAWVNEMREVPYGLVSDLLGRLRRFPSKEEGGPSWTGMLGDTNMPHMRHYLHDFAELKTPSNWGIYKQPGALVKDGKGGYLNNPAAENIHNLTDGFKYYREMIPGKRQDWIDVYACCEYGNVFEGRPVYQDYYQDALHCRKLEYIPSLPLHLCWDFGLSPACLVLQVTPRGQIRVLREYCAEWSPLEPHVKQVVLPSLVLTFPGARIEPGFGDPAGADVGQSVGVSCYEVLARHGLPARPVSMADQRIRPRIEAVVQALTTLISGEPQLVLDPQCVMLREGFQGGYAWKQLQVSGDARYTEKPDKNEYSHPHDALQYGILGLLGRRAQSGRPRRQAGTSGGAWRALTG